MWYKKHFNKNLIMSEKDEHEFQLTNLCWISEELTDSDDENIRDHCHITGKFWGEAHWNWNVNFKVDKTIP